MVMCTTLAPVLVKRQSVFALVSRLYSPRTTSISNSFNVPLSAPTRPYTLPVAAERARTSQQTPILQQLPKADQPDAPHARRARLPVLAPVPPYELLERVDGDVGGVRGSDAALGEVRGGELVGVAGAGGEEEGDEEGEGVG